MSDVVDGVDMVVGEKREVVFGGMWVGKNVGIGVICGSLNELGGDGDEVVDVVG